MRVASGVSETCSESIRTISSAMALAVSMSGAKNTISPADLTDRLTLGILWPHMKKVNNFSAVLNRPDEHVS